MRINPVLIQRRVDHFIDLYRTIDECVDPPELVGPPEPVIHFWSRMQLKEAAQKPLPYSIGKSVRSNKVKTSEFTFKEFVDECKTPKQLSTLRDDFAGMDKSGRGKVKAPNPYVTPGCIPAGVRRRGNVESITMLCIDIDKPEFAEKAAAALPDLKLNHFAYPTISSDVPDVKTRGSGLRLRIFVETDGSIPVQLYKPAVESFLATLLPEDLNVDTASFKPENAMFFPMCFKDDEGWEPLSVLTGGEVFTTNRIEKRSKEVPELETDRPAATSDEIALANMPSGEPLEKIQSALGKIPPDVEYGEWYRMLSGIHHELEGSEGGYTVADDWSGGAYNYNEEENRKFWDGLTKKKLVINPVTIASVFAAAKNYGWDIKSWKAKPEELVLTVEAAKARLEALPFEKRLNSVFYERSNREKPPELIKGLLAQNKLVGLVGSGGSGKNVTFDTWSYSLLSGTPFCGCPVHKFDFPDGKLPLVVLIAAEDAEDCDEMWRAVLISNGEKPDAYARQFVIRELPIGLQDEKNVKDFTQTIQDYALVHNLVPVLVGFDSLIRNSSPGTSENRSDDMALALTNIDLYLRKPLRCTSVVFQHTPHDKKRSRGSSAFFDQLSQELFVKGSSGIVNITCNKYRGGNAGSINVYGKIKIETTGKDADGYPTTSVCLVALDKASKEKEEEKRKKNPQNVATANDRSVLEALKIKPSTSRKELAERVGMNISSLGHSLTRMDEKGLVKLDKIGTRNHSSITAEGLRLLEEEPDIVYVSNEFECDFIEPENT